MIRRSNALPAVAALGLIAQLGLAQIQKAQLNSQAGNQNTGCSVAGTVRDATTGQPVADVQVAAERGSEQSQSRTGLDGRYAFKALSPGAWTLRAARGGASHVQWTRLVNVAAGQEFKDIDFRLPKPGVLAGTIRDDDGKPLAGVRVTVRSLFYFRGVLTHMPARTVTANDLGAFRFAALMPGRPYIILAGLPEPILISPSEGPVPKSKPGWERTYYPDSALASGATPITLGPGEVREGIDFRLRKKPSFCIHGLLTGAIREGALVTIQTLDPLPGWSSRLGHASIASSGAFVACGLAPGSYRMVVTSAGSPPSYGVTDFDIFDRNLTQVVADLQPPLEVHGQATWAGAPPQDRVSEKFRLVAIPEDRDMFAGESIEASSEIPGEFVFKSLYADPYLLRLYDLAPGVYAKEISYGTSNLLRESLRPGATAGGGAIRVAMAYDGAQVRIRVVDRDQKPVQDAGIIAFPRESTTEPDLARFIRFYGTDQDGYATIRTLAPGRYYALATNTNFEATPAVLRKLLDLRSKAKEIDLSPHGRLEISLEPVDLP